MKTIIYKVKCNNIEKGKPMTFKNKSVFFEMNYKFILSIAIIYMHSIQ